jgi:DNA-binding CsgD family transcriptional regulator
MKHLYRLKGQSLLWLFGGVGILAFVDLFEDFGAGTSWFHIAMEGSIMGLAGAGMAIVARELIASKDRNRQLQSRLAERKQEAARWQKEARKFIEGLSEAIERQFERWDLSPAEKNVARLLLKGFSYKEIADLRDVSDRTIRQQAHAVYKKADLSGRAELSAFFLEDILAPTSMEEEASQ